MINDDGSVPKRKFSMSNLKGILIDKTIELVFLIVIIGAGVYVQNQIFKVEISENKKQIELLMVEVNRTVSLVNQHLVSSEGRSVSLDELRRRVGILETKIDAIRDRELYHQP